MSSDDARDYEILRAVHSRDKALLASLLRQPASLQSRFRAYNEAMHSPFVCAVQSGDVDIVRILLHACASPNVFRLWPSVCSQTPPTSSPALVPKADVNLCGGFHYDQPLVSEAVRTGRGQASVMGIVELLIDNGVDLQGRGYAGESALHVACRFNSMPAAECLLRRGIDVNFVDKFGANAFAVARSPAMIHLLLKYGADIHMRGAHTTCLHQAIRNGEDDTLLHFLAFGVSTEELDEKGRTSLALCDKTLPAIFLLAAGADPRGTRWEQTAREHADEIARARRQMADIRNSFVRDIAFPICIGLQPLELPAFATVCIVDAALGPRDQLAPFHFKWQIATAIKHFNHIRAE